MNWKFWKKKVKPEPIWSGKCGCCGKYIEGDYIPAEEDIPKLFCYPCLFGTSYEGKKHQKEVKKKKADRHKIELMKTALRELEIEKNEL